MPKDSPDTTLISNTESGGIWKNAPLHLFLDTASSLFRCIVKLLSGEQRATLTEVAPFLFWPPLPAMWQKGGVARHRMRTARVSGIRQLHSSEYTLALLL